MSELGPAGGDNPFGSFLGDMMKMFMSDGPLNWQLARQAALVTATGGETEPNVDPLDRVRLEELIRVADLYVSDATGLSTSQAGGVIGLRTVTRAEWAYHTLDAYRGLFETLATALTQPGVEAGATDTTDMPTAPDAPDDESGLLGNLPQVLGPVMLGAQAGSLAGFLARRALGQYDLPIPRPAGDELLMVPSNITSFATDWNLPPDDLRLWVCLSELTTHAVIGRPHVRARMESLLDEYVRGFRVDSDALANQLDNIDLSNPQALPDILNNPEALLGAMQTEGQNDTLAQLGALVAALQGYVDHVIDTTGRSLIASYGSLSEALRRRRVETTDADRLISQLLGLELRQAEFDRGTAFVRGVVERAGETGLARLWLSERELPTPAEIDAPGLWLERIDMT